MHEHCGHAHPEPNEANNPIDTVMAIKAQLHSMANPQTAQRMLHEGYLYKVNLGVSLEHLRPLAQQYANNHELALALYRDDLRECKLLAALVDSPLAVTDRQIDEWANDFNNIEIVDFVCNNLLSLSRLALVRSYEWCLSPNAMLQRAGLVMIAKIAERNRLERIVLEPYIELAEDIAAECSPTTIGPLSQALLQIARHSAELRQAVANCAQRLQQHSNPPTATLGNELLLQLQHIDN